MEGLEFTVQGLVDPSDTTAIASDVASGKSSSYGLFPNQDYEFFIVYSS